jgi:2-keto-3-deoxy-L-rhamnonate aldolase RhmA
VESARELVGTPGVKVIFLGPMSLTTAFEGDSAAVESAIQSVLAVCKENDVACGITAGAEDVAERVRQGFRFLVVREPEVLAAGRAAAGR